MPSAPPTTDDPADFRVHVVAESIRLFAEQGYEATTVEQVAAAAGISRRTFFRQFGAKEDVIFADHESLLTQVSAHLAADDADPYAAVCSAAEVVFLHFRDSREMAVRRLRVVQGVPALRDRELVTTYRYQRVFEDFLRARLPEESPARLIGYAAAVTSAHNFLLRAMIRGDEDATLERLRAELGHLRGAFTRPEAALGDDLSVAVAVVTRPVGSSPEEVGRLVAEQLRAAQQHRGQ
ncbi:TetR family transcriptional regulator [Gordonia sp. PKS22-38]|uniref:TetR family transcriptional regulator n=1 Tax=Gordonia prachuapensis TaxID=3115651 RepID=A0ABU7MZR7_9ACTN|nr:TetR family transcriptional regulator [Gordonia sp. PKS22-38]